jgi:hypothetical protein
LIVDKMKVIQNLIAQDVLIPEEVLDHLAGEYEEVKDETVLTFEEFARIRFLEAKIKIIDQMR